MLNIILLIPTSLHTNTNNDLEANVFDSDSLETN